MWKTPPSGIEGNYTNMANWNLYVVHKISKSAIYRLQVYMSNI